MKYIKKYEELEDKSKIKELYLSRKNLTELPDLSEYTNLKKLYFYDNQLTSLPELPNKIEYLYCYDNQLTSLPELPESLMKLDCSNNSLAFEDLDGYKEWYKNNKHIIETNGFILVICFNFANTRYWLLFQINV